MARGGVVNLGIAADTRPFERAIDSGVIDPLEDVAEALKDTERYSEKAGDQLERSMKEAGDATEKLADEHKDLARTIERYSREARDDIKRNYDAGASDAGSAVGEFKEEARSNFSEVVSSFDGSMDSIADLAQGTFGGLAGSLMGPVGLAAGAIAALGGTWYASWKANAEQAEQRVADMYEDMKESGNGFLSDQFVSDQLAKIFGKTDDAAVSWDRLQSIVDATGKTEAQVARAFAGDGAARIEVLEALKQKHEELAEEQSKVVPNGYDNTHVERMTQIGNEISAVDRYRDILLGMTDEQADAADRANSLADALGSVGDAASEIPANISVKVDPDTGQFENKLRPVLNKQRKIRVEAEFVTRDGKVIR